MTSEQNKVAGSGASFKHINGDTTIEFQSVEIPNARTVNGNIFPLVLEVKVTGESTLSQISESLHEISVTGKFSELLSKHGAVLLRGLGDNSSEAFSKFITAIETGRGRTPFEQIGLAGKRFKQATNVYTANEGPASTRFYQHNEYARYSHFPSNIHFFAQKVPRSGGGGSPIANSNEFYNKVNEEIPEFIQDLSRKKLISIQVYPSRTKSSTSTKGNEFFWEDHDSFGKEILKGDSFEVKQKKAEKQIRRLTDDFSWNEDGSVTVRQHVPAFRKHPITGLPVFFNGLNGRYGTSRDNEALQPPYVGKSGGVFLPPTYENGDIIPFHYLEVVNRISREIEFLHNWKEGDLLLVDNYQVSHGREPWQEGDERVILVSMWDDLTNSKPEAYTP